MLKWALKIIGIALVVCLIWFLAIAFSPFYIKSVLFNVIVSISTCILATAGSVAFAYRILSSRKVIVGVIMSVACGLIAFPVYGPGQMMDNVFRFQGYIYLPVVGVFVAGVFTTYLFSRRKS